MIEVFRHDGKWRIKIINETLEFSDSKSFKQILNELADTKEIYEPYKKQEESK